jgi:putative membrane-bound dehydrogenase-like protein
MARPAWVLFAVALALTGGGAATPQDPPGPEGPPLKVPEGFVVERVAGPPQVERPIMASFDDRGRLYVTDSAGVNLRGSELLKDPPHRIRLLEDTKGEGRFDRSTIFADKLVFPQGLLWHDGAVYTTSPPSFWRLESTKGDGVCDKRTELVQGLANTGVADDAHGACLGPDGRIYFLPGRMAHNLTYPDGKLIRKATGPWLMRMKTDGSEIEIVSGCQGNPVEVDWTPEGDFFISGTFWAPDSFGGGLRDALIHGVEGGEYPVRDRVYSDRKRTGDLLPVMVPMIATAPSGMMIYRSAGIGKEYTGNLFCTYFNMHKVQRHILERDGATWRARTEDFVTSTHPDFHPTDVLEDADGSILVVDTGGWFRIGCPTSQIAKPQVLGGIYRIRRKEMQKVEDPRGAKADWRNPVSLFDDPRWVVRERAIGESAKRGVAGLKEALSSPSPRVRLNSVWALCRIDGPEARAIGLEALSDKDPGVRQAATISAGLHRERSAVPRLRQMVTSDLPQIRRECATALGRIGDREAVASLLDSIRAGADRFLEHSLIFALIRLADREAMLAALKEPGGPARRAALIALDQMEGGNLTQDLVTPLLDPVDAPLQQAALRVILSRPTWGREILGLAGQWLADPGLDDLRQETLRGIIVSFAANSAFQDLLARAMREPGTPASTRVLVLESMARSPLDRMPPTWLAEARWSLDSPDEKVVRQAVATLKASGTADFDEALLRLARDEARSIELRSESLAASTSRVGKLEAGLFRFLLGCLEKDKAPLTRVTAAEALGRSTLDDGQLEALARVIPQAGPLEVPRLIPSFERSKNAGVGRKLLGALEKSPGFQSLSGEALRSVLRNYPEDVRTQAEPLLKKLEVDTTAMKARLDELAPVLTGGDAARGRDVFYGKKAGCTACHTVAGTGGKVGPDLSKIGSIRAGRDLLEAIVFPSATFARGYEPFLLRTKDGSVYDGLIVRETAEAIVLFTPDRVEKRIPRSSIDEIRQGKISVMPQGLDAQISRDELRDLIAFLMSLR